MRLTPCYLLFAMLLFCNITLHAQNKPAPFKLFFEKAYLHTDRDLYTQGDTIWYKAYLVNAQNNQLIGTSGNLYIEMIQQDSTKLIGRQIIRMDFGLGNGDMLLPDSIPSGKYILRAYTNWMRNFGDNFIFEKELTIVNTQPVAASPIPKPGNTTSKIPAVVNTKIKNVVNTPVARFYPESGSLIEGVPSLVAIKAEDRLGKGMPASGTVLNSSGDTVAHFNCDTLGMGLFALMPLAGQKYHAQITSKIKKDLSVDMSQPLVKGFALHVTHTDSTVTVIANCNSGALSDAKEKMFTLSGKHSGKTIFNKSIQLSDLQTLIRISTDLFPSGISSITLTDEGNKPQCERLVYIHHKTSVTVINTDKTSYQSKEKVTVHINTGERANLSMCVVDAGIVPLQVDNIEGYLNLQSELKGKIEYPERYFDTTNVNSHKQLDLLLMTQGWRDFVWRRLADSAIRISYKAEDGIDISGKVKNENSDTPLPGLNITLLASANKGPKLLAAITDEKGGFSFPNLLYYGDHPVKLSSTNANGEKKGTFYIDTLATLPTKKKEKISLIDAPKDTIKDLLAKVIKRQADIQSANSHSTKNLKEVKITASKSLILNNGALLTSWGPDQSFDIKPKDYEYKTLEWFILQNAKGAIPSNKANVTGVLIPGIDTVEGRVKYTLIAPLLFINGRDYSTDNEIEAETYRSTYYPMPIEKFKRVVIKHFLLSAYGNFIDKYLIYLSLTNDAMAGYNTGSLNPAINGYYQARTFYKPLYDTPKSLTKTDLRATIHWEPNITTDAKGEATVSFYNADPKTKARVVVQGIKAAGGAINSSFLYDVK